MGRPRGIPPKYEPAILEKAGEGMTTRELAAWLLAEHQVQTSHKSVSLVLKRIKTERAQITQAVAREKLSKTVVSDIDRYDRIRRAVAARAARVARILDADGGEGRLDLAPLVNAWRGLKGLELQTVQKKLELAGAVGEKADTVTLEELDALREAAAENACAK